MAVEPQKQSSKRQWFRKSDSDEIDDEALRLANAARVESNLFREMARASLKGVDLQSQLQKTQSGLVDQLNSQRVHPRSVAIAAAGTLEKALAARDEWRASREHGLGKFASSMQRFATSLASFIGAYSGIVDAVKSAGGPYGEAGYQAISVLLIVALNKSQNDIFISIELENLVDCFPRIDLLAQIYPDATIERRVLEVHSGVILFAKEAATYFLSSSNEERFGKALKPSQDAQDAVKVRVDSIRRSLAELNAWSTALMHLKTQELIDGKNELLAKIKGLELDLSEMKKRDEQRHKQECLNKLEAVRVSLGRPDEKLNSNPEECLRSHNVVFPSKDQSSKLAAKYLQMSLTLLKTEDSYRDWAESKTGCLLILGGKTKMEGQLLRSGHSWLSPAATLTAEMFRKDEDLVVAFFSFHPESWWQHDEEPPSLGDLFAGLLFQVLCSDATMLEDDFQRQLAALSIDKWVKTRGESLWDVIMSRAIPIFRKASQRHWVYLVVDRAELCSTTDLASLLEMFRDLVKDPKCRIKVLVVFDTGYTRLSENEWQGFLDDPRSRGHVYSKTAWNQEKQLSI